MNYLLDVNVLIALADSSHEHHDRVSSWFHGRKSSEGWATCPLTENGFLRILGNPNYPGVKGDPQSRRIFLRQICSWPGHQFWPDSFSIRDPKLIPHLSSSRQLTDLYLLGLAVANHGALATLDERIDSSLVAGGQNGLLILK